MSRRVSRPAVWVGFTREQHLRVDVLRRYPNRLVCRVVEPGEFLGVVCDLHPGDVVEVGR